MARRRFFVDSIKRGHAQIIGQDAHHLSRVLRVEPGQKFEISDNHNLYLAEVETARKDLISFAVVSQMEAGTAALHTLLFAALTKFERFEWMLEMATELGVEKVIPVETGRSEKGLEAAAGKRLVRWQRIAREASEQSRRVHLPTIEQPIRFEDALTGGSGYRLGLVEAGGRPILSVLPEVRSSEDQVSILVGPEGGWTDREFAAISSSGWQAASLGGNILRAETAAVACLAIVNAAWDSAGAERSG
jgi:16S rRNA (uracil1498-N3)-methyltransferase